MAVPLKDFRTAVDEHTDIALTAAAAGAGKDKAAVARDVLKDWAKRKAHEYRVYARALAAHGLQTEFDGLDTEDDGPRRSGAESAPPEKGRR